MNVQTFRQMQRKLRLVSGRSAASAAPSPIAGLSREEIRRIVAEIVG